MIAATFSLSDATFPPVTTFPSTTTSTARSNLLAFCAVACLHPGRLSLRAQIAAPLLVILLLLAATAGVALRLDLPGTAVARCVLPALALLVRARARARACVCVLGAGYSCDVASSCDAPSTLVA